LADADDFPTDRYVLQGLAETSGRELRLLHGSAVDGLDTDAVGLAIDADTALVCLSHVNFRSGARLDLAQSPRQPIATAHSSVGLVPQRAQFQSLGRGGRRPRCGLHLQVLNGGPGSPPSPT